jgi:HTH-type transcriptional regulator, competence development regulator
MNDDRSRRLLAANIRRCRQQSGLSQEDVAQACRCHRTEISLLERGGRDPRLSTLLRVARALRVPVARLVDGLE